MTNLSGNVIHNSYGISKVISSGKNLLSMSGMDTRNIIEPTIDLYKIYLQQKKKAYLETLENIHISNNHKLKIALLCLEESLSDIPSKYAMSLTRGGLFGDDFDEGDFFKPL